MRAKFVRSKRLQVLSIDSLGCLIGYLIKTKYIRYPATLPELKTRKKVDPYDVGEKIWGLRQQVDKREELCIQIIGGVTLHLISHQPDKPDMSFWHIWITNPQLAKPKAKALKLKVDLEMLPEFHLLEEPPK